MRKFIMITKILWALALILCVPLIATAQQSNTRDGSWELNASGGLMFVDGSLRDFLVQSHNGSQFTNSDSPISRAPTAVVSVGYNFNTHYGFRVSGMRSSASGVTYLTPEASLVYTTNVDAKTAPFVLIGTEITRIEGQNSRVTHSTWGGLAGVGIRQMVGSRFALRLDGQVRAEGFQELYMTKKTVYNPVITLGLSYFTGGRQPKTVVVAYPSKPTVVVRVDTFKVVQKKIVTDTIHEIIHVISHSEQIIMRVQFETDKSDLSDVSRSILDAIVASIHNTPNSHWEVQGHTDNVGTDSYNQALGQRRAQSVVDYLVKKGVDRHILSIVSYGETRPTVSNDSVAGRSQNRRVQILRIQ